MLKEDVNIIIAVIIMNPFSLSAFAVNEVDYANEETDVSIEELNYSITLDTSKEDKKITIFPFVELGMMEFLREIQWQCYCKWHSYCGQHSYSARQFWQRTHWPWCNFWRWQHFVWH